jgi:hypothetical protein
MDLTGSTDLEGFEEALESKISLEPMDTLDKIFTSKSSEKHLTTPYQTPISSKESIGSQPIVNLVESTEAKKHITTPYQTPISSKESIGPQPIVNLVEPREAKKNIDFSLMRTTAIHVGYIYQDADLYLINNIYDLSMRKLNNLNDLYKLINVLLHDIIDIVIKSMLRHIKNKYRYQIFGGKAFERIMNPLYDFVPSFDFDIELEGSSIDALIFTEFIAMNSNEFINYQFGPMRYFIKNILFKYNLIDGTCFDYYENKSNNLIYYGTRKTKSGEEKLSVFINLLLKKDLFIGKLFNNSTSPNPDFNVFFYPICDIKIGEIHDRAEQDDIYYAPILKTFYGFLYALVNDTKVEKNIERIKNLKNENIYLCNPNFGIPNDKIKFLQNRIADIQSIDTINLDNIGTKKSQLSLYNLGVNTNLDMNGIMLELLSNYYDTYKQFITKHNMCELFPMVYTSNVFQIIPSLLSPELDKIVTILKNIDQKYNESLKIYTKAGHRKINLYCQLKNVKLDNIPNINSYFDDDDVDIWRTHTTNLENIYQDLYTDSGYINLIDNLFKEEFEVLSFQTFLYFNDPNGSISDASNIIQERGSIIYMPNFLSTGYEFPEKYILFSSSAKVLYRIKIKNKRGIGKNWLVIDKYSNAPGEKEILIKADSYFVIENIDFVPMNDSDSRYFNMKVITMKLCDNLNDAIEFSKQFSSTHLLYGQFDETLFTGGRVIDEKPTVTPKPNYIINPYTIMINPELFNDKYKYLKNTDDIIKVYQKYYPLFEEVINKYANKISIINTEKQTYNVKYQEKLPAKTGTNISSKYGYTPSLQRNKLSKLNVPGLYSDLEQQMRTEIQTGGSYGENKKQFYHKYLKYKLKYLMLNNER